MKSILVLAIFLATAGCATSQKFSTKMDSFIGQPEVGLVSVYGVPQSSYALQDGSKILQYTRSNSMVLPGATTMQAINTNTSGNVTVNQGMRQATGNYTQQSTTHVPTQGPAINVALSCTVTFTVDSEGIVRRWVANGNHCVSK